jgi:hypothetical protein
MNLIPMWLKRRTIRSIVEERLAECELSLLHAQEQREDAEANCERFEIRRERLLQTLREMVNGDQSVSEFQRVASAREDAALESFGPFPFPPSDRVEPPEQERQEAVRAA